MSVPLHLGLHHIIGSKGLLTRVGKHWGHLQNSLVFAHFVHVHKRFLNPEKVEAYLLDHIDFLIFFQFFLLLDVDLVLVFKPTGIHMLDRNDQLEVDEAEWSQKVVHQLGLYYFQAELFPKSVENPDSFNVCPSLPIFYFGFEGLNLELLAPGGGHFNVAVFVEKKGHIVVGVSLHLFAPVDLQGLGFLRVEVQAIGQKGLEILVLGKDEKGNAQDSNDRSLKILKVDLCEVTNLELDAGRNVDFSVPSFDLHYFEALLQDRIGSVLWSVLPCNMFEHYFQFINRRQSKQVLMNYHRQYWSTRDTYSPLFSTFSTCWTCTRWFTGTLSSSYRQSQMATSMLSFSWKLQRMYLPSSSLEISSLCSWLLSMIWLPFFLILFPPKTCLSSWLQQEEFCSVQVECQSSDEAGLPSSCFLMSSNVFSARRCFRKDSSSLNLAPSFYFWRTRWQESLHPRQSLFMFYFSTMKLMQDSSAFGLLMRSCLAIIEKESLNIVSQLCSCFFSMPLIACRPTLQWYRLRLLDSFCIRSFLLEYSLISEKLCCKTESCDFSAYLMINLEHILTSMKSTVMLSLCWADSSHCFFENIFPMLVTLLSSVVLLAGLRPVWKKSV